MAEHSPTPPEPGPIPATGSSAIGCAEEFAADERLLRAGTLAVRVSVLDQRAVSYGVGVRTDAAYLRRAEADGTPTVRRTTGGTGVLHLAGDLAWSVVLPRGHPTVGRDFVRAYGRIGSGVVRWLERHGVESSWRPAPGLNPDYCVLSDRGEVLVARGRILGGAAQQLTSRALLHQGMVARSVDRERVVRLFAVGPPSVLDRLGGLDDLGVSIPSVDAARELAAELARDLGSASE